ncbi:IucA/IucC family protein [Streptomyces qinzhouensis]|uniref:IucA/IucC family siderophore biosynthesis protein n=1 Tax=Streptomyces qinzhouensis TaxID=2599401 RepID=A0A5B8JRY1_9ACTN|nr:IucA/IucC family protein [Streptomyces qinzhouensis]QDY80543.1 IucA/IucC family siderophore biosynthesis protein [Streptomyces qinzhouensis]
MTDAPVLLDVLSTLLREDAVGLRSRSTRVDLPDGAWLRLPAHDDALLLPVRTAAPAFQYGTEARLPLLRRESDGTELTTTTAVLRALGALADPRDRPGFAAFEDECRQAETTVRLHRATDTAVRRRLGERYGTDPAHWTGPAAALAFDTLAARLDHPVHPTGRGRHGLTAADLRAYAPEFHPRFPLRWLAVPADALSATGPLDGLCPPPSALGLPARLDTGHRTIPVHPLTAGAPLSEALAAAGLTGRAHLAPEPRHDVVPTLSMRTVALADDPAVHLKLPLATATLGRLNRRTIKPGTLADGAAVQRILTAVAAREPRFRATVLHADETVWAHAGHELLAVLVRHQPPGLDTTTAVPLAALLAPAPGGGLVADRLADRFHGGDPLALIDAVLTRLLDWGTTLLGYGIALESHQQNITLLYDDGTPGPRLLLKDNDGPRIHPARLRAALGETPALDFSDPRIVTHDDRALLDLFTTITVHLCAGAYAFGLARHGHAPLHHLLGLIRDRLAEAARSLGTGPGSMGALLRTQVLEAARLPVKAMVTAGTLLAKERSGALDINKHYTTGPNYLLRGSDPR